MYIFHKVTANQKNFLVSCVIRMFPESAWEGECVEKLFLRMMRKSRRIFMVTLFSEIFIIAIIFFSLMVGSGLLYVSENQVAEMTPLIFKMEETFLVPYFLLMFLQILVLLDYVRKRSTDYAILTVLGMKRKHRYLFMAKEYLCLIVGSIAGGIFLGFLGGSAIKPILEHIFRDVTSEIIYGMAPFKLTLIVCAIMFGMGFVICDEIISCLGLEYVISGGVKTQRSFSKTINMMFSTGSIVLLIFVLLTACFGILGDLSITVLAVVGIAAALSFLGKNYLRIIRKNKKIYYKKILWLDDWYGRFQLHMNKAVIIASFLMISIMVFNLTIINNVPVTQTENYLYDLVWHGNEGDEFFLNELKETYGISYQTIPSIRVTTGDHGEHMGISASEYEKLTGKQIELSEEEIYIVYQSDRAEKGMEGIDHDDLYPDIFIGNATADIWVMPPNSMILPSKFFTKKYRRAGSEERILTGNFKSRAIKTWYSGVFEEIIVFSDAEFGRLRSDARGANLTVLMNIPKDYKQVVKEVYAYAKKYSQVNFFDAKDGNLIYERTQSLIENRQEKIFQVSAASMNLIILIVCSVFLLIEAIEKEKERREWKYQYWNRLGMPIKKRKKTLYNEIQTVAVTGVVGGIPFGFLLMMGKMLNKKLGIKWSIIYMVEGIGISIMLAGILLVIVRWISHSKFFKLERKLK